MRAGSLLVVTVLAAAGAGRAAADNGVIPHTKGIAVGRQSLERFAVLSDIGLLVTSDGGESFQWICGEAVGYRGGYEPALAIGQDGAIWATTPGGLQVSRDGGCRWDPAGEEVGPGTAVVTVGPDGRVWAARAGAGLNRVVSAADGAAFAPTGLEADGTWWLSLVVPAGDAERIYVSGYRLPAGQAPAAAVLVRSVDGGESWQELATGDIAVREDQPYLRVVGASPVDPDLVFAVAQAVNLPLGDALYRSADGGLSWTHVLDLAHPLGGLVVRADGVTVIAGSAGPCLDQPEAPGGCVQISEDGGASFRRAASQPRMACLAERADGALLACGANWEPDHFALGRSDDGEDWVKVYRFVETEGPLECPADTLQASRCAAALWPPLCERLGRCERRPDAGPDEEEPAPPGGCCRVGGGGGGGAAGLTVLLLLISWRAGAARRGAPRRRPAWPAHCAPRGRRRAPGPRRWRATR